MANNRMFLVHIPTGLAAPLGKRNSWGWYVPDGAMTVDAIATGYLGDETMTNYACIEGIWNPDNRIRILTSEQLEAICQNQ